VNAVHDPLEALILDLLEWVGRGSRPYVEVIDAWRTSCPRLPVWEEANARGLVVQSHDGAAAQVALSPSGLERLDAGRRR
jgi:D-3-phosphoglycerate dehydrogenase